MRTTLIAVITATLSVGCQGVQVPDFRGDAEEVIESARTRAGELQELSAEELGELWAIEYTSLEVAQTDLPRVDELLNEMGQGPMGLLPRRRERAGSSVLFQAKQDERGRLSDESVQARRGRFLGD